jgi:amidase
MSTYIYRSAGELADLIKKGEATSSEILNEHIAHIKKHNPSLQAVVRLLENEARETASMRDREAKAGIFKGPLHGVPMTIKEQYWLKGTKSTLNSNRFKTWVATENAVIVNRLEKAGAIIMGKSNVAKELLDYQTNGDIYSECKNPYHLDHTPGGSSGGAAAALASGMTPLELGWDFGGSIRVPSNFCGLYGLKPTENTIPRHGNVPKSKSAKSYLFDMATGGPMARTPEDLALLWNIIKGPHKTDPMVPPVDWSGSKRKKLADYKIAWVDGWPGFENSLETKNLIKEFIKLIDEKGGHTKNVLPGSDLHERSLSVYRKLSFQMILQDVPWFFKPLVMGSLKRGFLKGMKEVHWKFKDSLLDYSQLMGQRANIIKEWEEFFEEFDLLICPSGNGPAFPRCKIGTPISFSGKTMKYLAYVWPYNACFNASGHPSMSLPLGIGNGGLPVGVQIVGPDWSEINMLSFAKLISEFTHGFVKPEGY